MDVDLSGLKVTDLDVNIGATDISIVLLETGPIRTDIRSGAAEINIRIPNGCGGDHQQFESQFFGY